MDPDDTERARHEEHAGGRLGYKRQSHVSHDCDSERLRQRLDLEHSRSNQLQSAVGPCERSALPAGRSQPCIELPK